MIKTYNSHKQKDLLNNSFLIVDQEHIKYSSSPRNKRFYVLQALNIQFTSKKTQKAPQSEVQMEFMKFTKYNFRDPNLETFCLFIYL